MWDAQERKVTKMISRWTAVGQRGKNDQITDFDVQLIIPKLVHHMDSFKFASGT